MATHSSILAWRIPWPEELGGLQSTGPPMSRVQSQVKYKIQRLKINLDLCKETDRTCSMVRTSLDTMKGSGRAWRTCRVAEW